ncbi:terminase small subunit, partial [Escherichia coli]|uniref:terminase small subunit n=1 Tax=Escherichia coli TaxID=562 RepID=UPI00397761A9
QRRFPELENRHVDFLKRDIIKAMNKAAALDELMPTLRQRLFRCVSIRENDDGTYAITAVQHVPEKEAIVDNGAHFDGDQSGTVNGVTPPAVQHLTAEVTADSGEY